VNAEDLEKYRRNSCFMLSETKPVVTPMPVAAQMTEGERIVMSYASAVFPVPGSLVANDIDAALREVEKLTKERAALVADECRIRHSHQLAAAGDEMERMRIICKATAAGDVAVAIRALE